MQVLLLYYVLVQNISLVHAMRMRGVLTILYVANLEQHVQHSLLVELIM